MWTGDQTDAETTAWHNTQHPQEIDIHAAFSVFEPAIPAVEGPQTTAWHNTQHPQEIDIHAAFSIFEPAIPAVEGPQTPHNRPRDHLDLLIVVYVVKFPTSHDVRRTIIMFKRK